MSVRLIAPSSAPRVLACALLIVAAALLAAGCAWANRLPQEEGLHPRLTPTTYLEEGKLVAFAVDTEPAGWREKNDFVPLPIAVLNKSLPSLTLTRESFTLVDSSGRRYAMATVAEGRSIGGLTRIDFQMARNFFEVIQTTYAGWNYEHAVFFPNTLDSPAYARRGLLRDRVELATRSWTTDMLYFPHPQGKLTNQRFELWLSAPELAEPVFIKFRVPSR